MKRREFIAHLGGVVAFPLTAHSRQSELPVVGLLSSRSADVDASLVAALQSGLAETGFVEGRNVLIEYRWAHGRYEQLDALASELVRMPVAVLVSTGGTVSARAAKAATKSIPIVFTTADDPVKVGLVDSLNSPGGNMTGITAAFVESASKRVGLLRDLLPKASVIGLVLNPNNPAAEPEAREIQAAADAVGLRVATFPVRIEHEIAAAFVNARSKRVDAVIIASDPFLFERSERIVASAAQAAMPTLYFRREFAVGGGLISYGSNFSEFFRVVGLYAGRILKGEKPSELPVQRPTKFELVLNLKTAKSLGIEISPLFLARTDEVIE